MRMYCQNKNVQRDQFGQKKKVFCCSNNMTIKSLEDLLESSNNLVTPVYFPRFYNSGISINAGHRTMIVFKKIVQNETIKM